MFSFSEIADRFSAWGRNVLAPSTVAVYSHYFRAWLQRYGDGPIERITPAQLTEFGRTWHACQAIQRLTRWACDEANLIATNPIARVKRPPKGTRRRILSPAETITWLRASPPDLRRLLIGYRETAARPLELRASTWRNLQAEDVRIDVGRALELARAVIVLHEWKDCQKRDDLSTPRVIILSPRMCRLLHRLWHKRESDDAPIFATEGGRRWTANALRCRFRRLRDRLNITRDTRGEWIVPYTWRHTAATRAAAAGVRDRLLADVLGHVETKTTARYCHLSVEHLRAAMQAAWQSHTRRHEPPR